MMKSQIIQKIQKKKMSLQTGSGGGSLIIYIILVFLYKYIYQNKSNWFLKLL